MKTLSEKSRNFVRANSNGWMPCDLCWEFDIHWDWNVILTKFSPLAAMKGIILTTSNAASDENFAKMKTLKFQCPLQWRLNGRDGVSNHRRLDCLLGRLFRRRSKKTSKLRVTGLCERNPQVSGGFPSQRSSNAENVSIWWWQIQSVWKISQRTI